MDDDDRSPSQKRIDQLAEAVMVSYDLIAALLAALPITIGIPRVDGESWGSAEGILALDRARTLIREEPISDDAKAAFQGAMIDWFTAYELLTLALVGGPAPWRMDALEGAVVRLRYNLLEVAKLLPKQEE